MGYVRRRLFGLAFLVLFSLSFVCLDIGVAYAANNLASYDGVVFGPTYIARTLVTSDVNSRQWVIVNAPDRFSAAVYAVGGNPADLDDTKKALLSNASTGGDFYTFSNLFVNLGGSFDYPDWMGGAEKTIYRTYEGVYGEDYVYVAAFTPAQKSGAAADYGVIAGGGSPGGGGGSGGTVAPTKTFELQLISTTLDRYFNVASGKVYMASAPSTTTVTLTDSAYNQVMAKYNAGYDVFVSMPTYEVNRNQWCNFYFVQHGKLTFEEVAATQGGGNLLYWRNRTGSTISNYRLQLYLDVPSCTIGNYVYSGSTSSGSGTMSSVNMSNGSGWTPNGSSGSNFGCYYVVFYADGTSSNPQEPTIPPTNWPESDPLETPQPPELPEPDNPVVQEEPDSTFPVYVDVSTTNYTADLQGVLDAMDDHCLHLQNAIWWGFSNFWNKLYQYITWSVGVMQTEFSATRDYLHDLYNWLAEQFDYSISGGAYNDSTVVSWLKKIFAALGLGVSTRPTDPVANPDGMGDWLGQLFANFIAWLTGFGAGVASGLASDFAQLTHKFPFCIPWDIAAMLTLLVAEPQAPSFDYPVYTLDSYGSLVQVATLEVDLSDYDVYMGGIRFMQKLLFCFYLAKMTPTFREMVRVKSVY